MMSVYGVLLLLFLVEITYEGSGASVTTSSTTAYTLGSELLYPYGSEVDKLSPPDDDGGPPLQTLTLNVPFFGEMYSSFYMNNNGFLSLKVNITDYRPPSQTVNYPFLAPFWSDVDNSQEGSIYYRQTNDSDLLVWATSQLKTYFRLYKFNATWIFVATWEKVMFHGAKTNQRNTFQVVLISDGKLTFALFNYMALLWPGYLSDPFALASLNNGTSNYTLPGSLTNSMTNLVTGSNVNVTGRWAFNIDSITIYFTETFIGKCNEIVTHHFTKINILMANTSHLHLYTFH
ncbi:sushi, nidogen and EGF-like domain-containing protein 1 [Rana temporaria]|uniref:sushi, nidogen and EGF-like domain-containing protein 1 n=1 Tax=Rana temporaria TaxID=8407 RepID=UPI001AAD0F00|nr:sushi, nidogen and EGF-like domain-containing protein 1 [Rana temporaria]